MKRILYYILINIAFLCRIFSAKLYMRFAVAAHKSQGVVFNGYPEYIQKNAYLDSSGGLIICKGVVISTHVIILSHDYSFLKRIHKARGEIKCFQSVTIGEDSFVGAGAIILPGTRIGKNCIIGAGAVIKGTIEDFSILVGNPAKKIGDTRHLKQK